MNSRRYGLALASVLASVAFAAACSSSGGGSGTPTPTPTPTPFAPTHCRIAWFNTTATPSIVDAVVVDVPIADWSSGVHAYQATSGALFFHNVDLQTYGADLAAAASGGSFSLTVSGSSIGASVEFSTSGGQPFFQLDTAGLPTQTVVATGGAGAFTGTISDPAAAPTLGTGTFAITGLTLGSGGAWSACYN